MLDHIYGRFWCLKTDLISIDKDEFDLASWLMIMINVLLFFNFRFCNIRSEQSTITMRWLRRSSETPQLLGLSPLRSEDSFSFSTYSISSIDHNQLSNEAPTNVFKIETPNLSTRKSRIGKNLCFKMFVWMWVLRWKLEFQPLDRFSESITR